MDMELDDNVVMELDDNDVMRRNTLVELYQIKASIVELEKRASNLEKKISLLILIAKKWK